MVVTASRQPGLRPETIRTRLARFMPSRGASGWTVTWSADTEHAEEITGEHELRAAEHLGCYGSAVTHALAQAELAPQRLRLSAESSGSGPSNQAGQGASLPVITIEVRVQISGPAIDLAVFEAIVRRAEPSCPVLKGLATEAEIRLVAILDDSLEAAVATPAAAATAPGSAVPAAAAAPAAGETAAATHTTRPGGAPRKQHVSARVAVKRPTVTPAAMSQLIRGLHMARQHAPKWLTARMAILLVIAFGGCAAAPAMWAGLG